MYPQMLTPHEVIAAVWRELGSVEDHDGLSQLLAHLDSSDATRIGQAAKEAMAVHSANRPVLWQTLPFLLGALS
jgi:hypothetical protein